jgi:adenylate cyclase
MPIEIERKFLVTGEFPRENGVKMVQSYLSGQSDTTVRVRMEGERAVITIKGPMKGISRPEFEYEIPLADAYEMIDLGSGNLVEKTRYYHREGKHTWEIDVFDKENNGLVIAEIELDSECECFDKPEWLGKEVTSDFRYANSSLSIRPYSNW